MTSCAALLFKILNVEEYSKRIAITLTVTLHVLIIALTIIVFGLSVPLLNSTRASASIASNQFMGNGTNFYGLYIGIIVLSSFHFLFILCLILVVLIT